MPLTLGLKLKESMCEQNPIALDLRIADRDVVVAYSGNMGIGHDFDMFKQKLLGQKIKFVFMVAAFMMSCVVYTVIIPNLFSAFYPHSDLR